MMCIVISGTFSSGRNLYETDFSTNKLLGALNGTNSRSIMHLAATFSFASGDKLQVISGSGKLATLESPVCDIVSVIPGVC